MGWDASKPSPLLSCPFTPPEGRNKTKKQKERLWIRSCMIDPLPLLRGCRCLRFLRFLHFLPRTRIAQTTPADAGTLTGPAKVLGEVLRGDLREKLVLVCAADDLD